MEFREIFANRSWGQFESSTDQEDTRSRSTCPPDWTATQANHMEKLSKLIYQYRYTRSNKDSSREKNTPEKPSRYRSESRQKQRSMLDQATSRPYGNHALLTHTKATTDDYS